MCAKKNLKPLKFVRFRTFLFRFRTLGHESYISLARIKSPKILA